MGRFSWVDEAFEAFIRGAERSGLQPIARSLVQDTTFVRAITNGDLSDSAVMRFTRRLMHFENSGMTGPQARAAVTREINGIPGISDQRAAELTQGLANRADDLADAAPAARRTPPPAAPRRTPDAPPARSGPTPAEIAARQAEEARQAETARVVAQQNGNLRSFNTTHGTRLDSVRTAADGSGDVTPTELALNRQYLEDTANRDAAFEALQRAGIAAETVPAGRLAPSVDAAINTAERSLRRGEPISRPTISREQFNSQWDSDLRAVQARQAELSAPPATVVDAPVPVPDAAPIARAAAGGGPPNDILDRLKASVQGWSAGSHDELYTMLSNPAVRENFINTLRRVGVVSDDVAATGGDDIAAIRGRIMNASVGQPTLNPADVDAFLRARAVAAHASARADGIDVPPLDPSLTRGAADAPANPDAVPPVRGADDGVPDGGTARNADDENLPVYPPRDPEGQRQLNEFKTRITDYNNFGRTRETRQDALDGVASKRPDLFSVARNAGVVVDDTDAALLGRRLDANGQAIPLTVDEVGRALTRNPPERVSISEFRAWNDQQSRSLLGRFFMALDDGPTGIKGIMNNPMGSEADVTQFLNQLRANIIQIQGNLGSWNIKYRPSEPDAPPTPNGRPEYNSLIEIRDAIARGEQITETEVETLAQGLRSAALSPEVNRVMNELRAIQGNMLGRDSYEKAENLLGRLEKIMGASGLNILDDSVSPNLRQLSPTELASVEARIRAAASNGIDLQPRSADATGSDLNANAVRNTTDNANGTISRDEFRAWFDHQKRVLKGRNIALIDDSPSGVTSMINNRLGDQDVAGYLSSYRQNLSDLRGKIASANLRFLGEGTPNGRVEYDTFDEVRSALTRGEQVTASEIQTLERGIGVRAMGDRVNLILADMDRARRGITLDGADMDARADMGRLSEILGPRGLNILGGPRAGVFDGSVAGSMSRIRAAVGDADQGFANADLDVSISPQDFNRMRRYFERRHNDPGESRGRFSAFTTETMTALNFPLRRLSQHFSPLTTRGANAAVLATILATTGVATNNLSLDADFLPQLSMLGGEDDSSANAGTNRLGTYLATRGFQLPWLGQIDSFTAQNWLTYMNDTGPAYASPGKATLESLSLTEQQLTASGITPADINRGVVTFAQLQRANLTETQLNALGMPKEAIDFAAGMPSHGILTRDTILQHIAETGGNPEPVYTQLYDNLGIEITGKPDYMQTNQQFIAAQAIGNLSAQNPYRVEFEAELRAKQASGATLNPVERYISTRDRAGEILEADQDRQAADLARQTTDQQNQQNRLGGLNADVAPPSLGGGYVPPAPAARGGGSSGVSFPMRESDLRTTFEDIAALAGDSVASQVQRAFRTAAVDGKIDNAAELTAFRNQLNGMQLGSQKDSIISILGIN